MQFSVVIPAYNAAGTIGAALDSVLAQTHPALEIIVVNDASTDHTAQLIAQHYPSVRLLTHTENKGVSAARNTGWEKAQGDYIAFLDSDDAWHPQKLALVAACIHKIRQPVLIGHDFTTDTSLMSRTMPDIYPEQTFFSRLLSRNCFQGSSMIVSSKLAIRFDERLRYCEDYDLALQTSYRLPVYFIRLPLTVLSRPQMSNGGLSGNKWAMRKGELCAYTKLARLNKLWIFALPFLWVYSLGKHFRKGF